MKSKGGFILINFDKSTANISATDFDKSIFREIVEKHIRKPLILTTRDSVFLFTCSTLGSTSVTFTLSVPYFDNGVLDSWDYMYIQYNTESDTITYEYISE